uniref:Uncharacterized protein n=1 Tax=Anguilla anguilla TaxID=7936 RepID=A0A0E9WKX6_ANGAN
MFHNKCNSSLDPVSADVHQLLSRFTVPAKTVAEVLPVHPSCCLLLSRVCSAYTIF